MIVRNYVTSLLITRIKWGGSPINNVVSAPETGCNSIENSGTPEATDEPNSDEGAHKGRGPGKSSHSVASGQH